MIHRILILLAALALPPAAPACAFTQAEVVQAEILPGWRTADGHHMAALSLTLAPGWKTYWRSPGEAGIPPVLDFAGSGNLAAVALHWPRPVVFDLNGMQTIGYHDRLVLPFEVTVIDPAAPARIRLHVDLGVCRDICLPATLDLSAVLDLTDRPDPAIRAALADRPMAARKGGLTAIRCAVEPIADGLRLTAVLDLPSQGGAETVVFEPADGSIWVAQATADRQGGTLTAATDLVPGNGRPFALDRSGVTVTVLGKAGAVEIKGCPGG